jgi:hypothetical protein
MSEGYDAASSRTNARRIQEVEMVVTGAKASMSTFGDRGPMLEVLRSAGSDETRPATFEISFSIPLEHVRAV